MFKKETFNTFEKQPFHLLFFYNFLYSIKNKVFGAVPNINSLAETHHQVADLFEKIN